jgi:O-antigen/teichoic acid export membrane protein
VTPDREATTHRPSVLEDSTLAAPPLDPTETRAATLSLGQRTGRGFIWSIVQTFTSKASSLIGQIALSYLLFPNDFGLVALAYTILGFTALIQSIGVREILVRKQSRVRRWQNPAFWFSATLSLTTMALVMLIAPLAAHVYREPDLTGVIRVLSLSMPLSMANVVMLAPAQVEMRFKFISAYGAANAVAKVVLQVVFAFLGFGPYSIVLPHPVVDGVCTVFLAWRLRPALRLRLHHRKWRFFLRDSVAIFLGNLCMTIAYQGVPFLLGLSQGPHLVGLYFWGYNLSMQTAQIIYANLTGVLFPALTSVDHARERQSTAFLGVSRMLALIAMPMSFMQALLADPAIRLVFDERWFDAIVAVQWLSIGMGMNLVSLPAISLLQAQGRFWRLFAIVGVWTALYLPMIAWLAPMQSLSALTLGIGLFYCVASPLFTWSAAAPIGVTALDTLRLYGKPAAACLIAFAPSWWVGTWLPQEPLTRIVITGGLASLLYAGTIRFIDPESWSTVIARARQVLGGRARPRRHPGAVH